MCTIGHAALKSDLSALRQHTSAPGIPERDETDTLVWYLRNCLLCGSTICIDPTVEEQLTHVAT